MMIFSLESGASNWNSYFRYRIFENTGAGAEFGNFALAKLANERRAGVLEYAVVDVTFSYCIDF